MGSYASTLLARMMEPADAATAGGLQRVDLARITDLELGTLLPTAWRVAHEVPHPAAAAVAGEICRSLQQRSPVFTAQACREFLDVLAHAAQQAGTGEPRIDAEPLPGLARRAAAVVVRCVDTLPTGVQDSAAALLRQQPRLPGPGLHWLVLAGLGGVVQEEWVAGEMQRLLADHPLALAEAQAVLAMDVEARALVCELAARTPWGSFDALPDLLDKVCAHDAYAAFAQLALGQALAHLQAIHRGDTPFAPDRAFSVEEAAVLGRAAQVALWRDAPWLPSVLDELLAKVCAPPGGAAGVPSQSVAIALGHAIEEWPTPEAVVALRAARSTVRHAGVAKRLERNLRNAGKRLSLRPEVALRLPDDQAVGPEHLAVLARALEGGYALGTSFRLAQWRQRLAEHPHARGVAQALVWLFIDPQGQAEAAMLKPDADGGMARVDVHGADLPAPADDVLVSLWHPVLATADDRAAWRARVAALRLKQPFRQVFREHYEVPVDERGGTSTSLFADHVLSMGPVIGVARRDNWRIEHGGLVREYGNWRIHYLPHHGLYYGIGGWTESTDVRLEARHGTRWRPARWGDAPPLLVSEALRAVDLLVSVGSFALLDHPALAGSARRAQHLQALAARPLSQMATMRRQALEQVLAPLIAAGRVAFDARHLLVGGHAIHLATGRVTRNGDPVQLELPARRTALPLPWLPYDEALLEQIAYAAMALAQ